jgi:HTH-type transcriptional regulator/antitoxin HipB
MSHVARTPKQLGAVLSRLRNLADLNQSDLGQKAGLRQATISKIESGSPTTQIGSICSVLAALNLELQIVPRRKDETQSIEDLF